MPRIKAYQRQPLTGGLNFVTGNCTPVVVSKQAKSPAESLSESRHQIAVFEFLEMNQSKFPIFADFYAVPNGGHRHAAVGAKLKREGVKRGVLDIALDAARRGFHGLKIEMKIDRNDLSDDQRYFRRRHIEENYCSHTAWHFAEAIKLILWYLEIDRKNVAGYPPKSAVVLPRRGGHDERCGCDLKITDLL